MNREILITGGLQPSPYLVGFFRLADYWEAFC